jgi:hypothetical protein
VKTVALSFLGLPLATLLWGFLGAGFITILLYILRLRRRRVRVAFLALWEKSLVERKASALRSRLQRLVSLLISLLLVAVLIFALGDPRPDAEGQKGKTIAIVLDVSASMATKDGDRTRLDEAKELVEERIESLGAGDQMLLIEMGAQPRPIEALTNDREVLEAALSEVTVLDVSADVSAALVLARDALRGRERSEVVIVSDGALPRVDGQQLGALPPLYFSHVGEPQKELQPNVGITAFSARRYPLSSDRFEVLVEVENSGDGPATIDLALFEAAPDGSEGPQLDQHRLTLAPGERKSQTYENLNQAEEGLIAVIKRADGAQDSFAPDDIARTLLAPRTPARVLVVGPPNNFLDAALLIDDSLQVVRVSEASYPPEGDFDVTIFDGVFPTRNKSTGAALYFAPAQEQQNPPEGFPVEFDEKREMFGFDAWKKDSTVFRLIDPYDIQVLTGHSLKPQSGDQVLGSSAGKPIFVAGDRPEGRFLALGFSPRKSDFVLRTAWPLFVVNALDELHPRGRTDAVLGLRTGTLWRPSVTLRKGLGKVSGPLGMPGAQQDRIVPVEDGRAVLFGQRAGFYQVVTDEGKSRFAASVLSSAEAELLATDEWKLSSKPLPAPPEVKPHAERKPWFWLLAVVLSVSFVEWWTFHRRWTV